MPWTKGDFALKAISAIGFASYTYDIEPEQLQEVLIALENMMESWQLSGVRVGWIFENTPSNIDAKQEVNVNGGAREAIIANLAIKIAPIFGKTVPAEIMATAKSGYSNLLTAIVNPIPMRLPSTMPVGQGNKPWRRAENPFVLPPCDNGLVLNEDQTID